MYNLFSLLSLSLSHFLPLSLQSSYLGNIGSLDVSRSQSGESLLHNVYMGPPSRTKVSRLTATTYYSACFSMLYMYMYVHA